MHLKILLPFKVFADIGDVSRIVAETPVGSFGLLPQRLDCAAELTPGILSYETADGSEVFVAVDAGVLVKAGAEVLVSVRRAMTGVDLGQLRQAVDKEFLALNEHAQNARSVRAKLEVGLVRRMATFQQD